MPDEDPRHTAAKILFDNLYLATSVAQKVWGEHATPEACVLVYDRLMEMLVEPEDESEPEPE